MFGALNLFFVIEAAYRNCIATVRQTGKEAGQGQADIARIIGFAEAFPFNGCLGFLAFLDILSSYVGVWILACVMPLPVCMLVGCCCAGADLSATMPWVLAEGEVRIKAAPRNNERENEITEIEWIKPVKSAISFGEIPAAWVSAVLFPSRLVFSAAAIV